MIIWRGFVPLCAFFVYVCVRVCVCARACCACCVLCPRRDRERKRHPPQVNDAVCAVFGADKEDFNVRSILQMDTNRNSLSKVWCPACCLFPCRAPAPTGGARALAHSLTHSHTLAAHPAAPARRPGGLQFERFRAPPGWAHHPAEPAPHCCSVAFSSPLSCLCVGSPGEIACMPQCICLCVL